MTEFTPCAPVYVVSSHRNKPVIQYRSKRWEGKLLEFRFKSHASKNVIYYQCIACKSVADLARISDKEKSPIVHLKLENGVVVTNPDFPSTLHNCNVDHDDNKAPMIRDVFGQFNNFGPRTTNYVEEWHNGLHSHLSNCHPTLAEIIGLFQIQQHSSKFRIQALKTDALALPLPQKPDVIRRNTDLHNEMRSFETYFSSAPITMYRDICNYIDRVILIGMLTQQL